MNVLAACECSGVVRDAFIARGHSAMSCDLSPSETHGPHYQGDVRDVLDGSWDLMIAHPPCTYLCVSGLHHSSKDRSRLDKMAEALDFVRLLMAASIPRICIENPVSVISTEIRKPEQIIQPYWFGEDASKRTCLWLKNLPPLRETKYIVPRYINGKPRWNNQTDKGYSAYPERASRSRDRSVTYKGIADAMATQWGALV